MIPTLPSGRTKYAVLPMDDFLGNDIIPGDGNVPNAITDLRDIGRYVARIIADPRTLNRQVFAYAEVWTPNQRYELIEKLSGEKIERRYVSLRLFTLRLIHD